MPEFLEEVVSGLDLEEGVGVYCESSIFDEITDVFFGVQFRDRPTDAQVEKATKDVEEALPKLKKAIEEADNSGDPSSAVEVWLVAVID